MTNFFRTALLLSALVATPALAQSVPAETRITVRTADLDLASQAGQRALDRRLAQAVAEACGTASVVDLAGSNAVDRCRDETSAAIAADRDRLFRLATQGSDIILAAR